MSAMKNNDLMMAAGLVIGAMLLARRAQAVQAPRNGAMNSLPGNVGTGAGQALGGALGGLLGGLFGTGKSNFVPNADGIGNTPDWNAAYQTNPELVDNVMQYGI